MRIGLVDVDGRGFPNLVLMKLAAWHKARGDTVEFADPEAGRYDKVYMSKVFTHSLRGRPRRNGIPGLCDGAAGGGRAYVSRLLAIRRG